jgi:DNA-binding transcriptional MerR regulator
MAGMAIGRLAELASTKVQTVRYYEQIGLISPFKRTEGGHRLFGPEDADRLKFIRHARELGFGIEEIRELLTLSDKPDTSCAAADSIARSHLEQVEIRLAKLKALQKELKRMVGECGHGRVSQCRVIEVLSDHKHCTNDH